MARTTRTEQLIQSLAKADAPIKLPVISNLRVIKPSRLMLRLGEWDLDLRTGRITLEPWLQAFMDKRPRRFHFKFQGSRYTGKAYIIEVVETRRCFDDAAVPGKEIIVKIKGTGPLHKLPKCRNRKEQKWEVKL